MAADFFGIIDRAQGKKIMLIGDMVADVYLEGRISRISREAPVLILEHAGETVVPGGAANAVHNAAALGGRVFAVGVVGDDNAGAKLAAILKNKGVNVEGLVVDNGRPTIAKTRIMAGGQATVRQQVVRIDKELKLPLDAAVKQRVIDYILENIGSMDAVVLSDYGSALFSPDLIRSIISECRRLGKISIVDSRYNILEYAGISVVKQNESEAAAALGIRINDEDDLRCAGRGLLQKVAADAVVITQGPDGMTVFERTGQVFHIPVTNKSEVYDVTGAGDTVVATMALALAAGASYLDAARLANYAAGIVVRKPGTATATADELREAIGAGHEDHY